MGYILPIENYTYLQYTNRTLKGYKGRAVHKIVPTQALYGSNERFQKEEIEMRRQKNMEIQKTISEITGKGKFFNNLV
ncbi:hypothetical protein [Priestia filamentosa]|uniref:Uncharacterized protein n=1 Tax=Priestia filamentosa TaxID=1402861 RepID=A0A1X7FL30_9BACI|nr:hypothetical protein [Priestia filamentosa]AKO91344.1 hypothetical protein BEH_03995 [Priestia filamentosa]MDT3765462.1 hypothetical protein [Priestia filamentosa]OXS67224.1 hypothetical protein B1B01_17170 [Priestia filamentosa]RJS65274.1 hypothetical protein CJ485_11095 [Priestia filamentosa]WCM16520.1 hypothetical protein PGN40_03990 [Priestia filamentosa]